VPVFGVSVVASIEDLPESKVAAPEKTAASELLEILAGIKEAYRPEWQQTPGYKTLVDTKSEKGIFPKDTENTSPDRGQSNLDSAWPVETPQSREKERALPLPSNHDKARDKRIGPTNYNKPRTVPNRTRSVPGEEYGHPTKFDYNYVRRRQDVTAQEGFDLEAAIANLERLAVSPLPKPNQRQKNLPVGYSKKMRRQYLKKRQKNKLRGKLRYRTQGKRDPQKKKYRRYYRMYPNRYKRRGKSPYDTPAERTEAWREKQKQRSHDTGLSQRQLDKIRKRSPSKMRSRKPSRSPSRKVYGNVEALAQMLESLAGTDWQTLTKKTVPPEQLSQNNLLQQPKSTVRRKDDTKQQGESLRAPNLDGKPQKGLQWEIMPKAPGGVRTPTVNNPGSGSGKALPPWNDFSNGKQQIPDGRQERYLHNNNFDVKVARSLPEILARVDSKIKARAAQLAPKLERTDTKNWTWHWRVGKHVVRVQAFQRGTSKSLTKLNLRVACSCPAWRWWGPEHWASKENYLRGEPRGTATPPKVRDPAHWRPVCKHAYAVLTKSKKFFVRSEVKPLKRLASRFSLDRGAADEVGSLTSAQREIASRVARRYVGREEG
jgi:hypothetical protein